MSRSGDAANRDKRDYWLLAIISPLISATSFIFYFRHNAILLYGDAVAHTNIARHVFDSRTPGLWELGTVWLPLPHLIDIPFVASHWMWQSGVGASIPSMLAYVFGVLGIFRLLRGFTSRGTAWLGALIYALNPNLIYMQATAMTEALYLALFIWAVVHFSEFVRIARNDPQRARRSLEYSGILISASMLVRYDGWFFAACATFALLVVILKFRLWQRAILRGAVNFVLLTSLTAGLWLVYNHLAYGNSLEFANGYYSAAAIAERMKTPTFPSYPGENSLRTAALYFLKVSRIVVAEGPLDPWLLSVAFIALVAAIYFSRRHLVLALLWVPMLFYSLSIAYGHVPIYFPKWYPFTYYNVRYGLQMLPAIAVFVALAGEFFSTIVRPRLLWPVIVLLAGASYFSIWSKKPVCLREAEVNGADRMDFDARLAAELRKLPPSATIMMYTGSHSGALQDVGIPFRRVVWEGNRPEWEIGLTRPAGAADYVVAVEDDEVFYAVRRAPENLGLVATVGTTSHPRATIYRSAHSP
ncbi:MAG TPA: glycosyltransferase family 39 protein [Candidatus Angelobacter sp.]